MPRQVYRCPKHGEFKVVVTFRGDVPTFKFCHVDERAEKGTSWRCLRRSPWVPSVPNFIGGPTTGAGKE